MRFWLPPLLLHAPGARPAAGGVLAFARASTDAQQCIYPGSVDDLPPRWFVNRSERQIGRGEKAYEKAAAALAALDCLELEWLTHSRDDSALAICSRQFGVLWMMNANRIIQQAAKPTECSMTWATTRRHVLCGEERLSVRIDDAGDVHFAICSFSRPRHLFSWLAYPYVVAQQRRFARDATAVMRARAASVGDL